MLFAEYAARCKTGCFSSTLRLFDGAFAPEHDEIMQTLAKNSPCPYRAVMLLHRPCPALDDGTPRLNDTTRRMAQSFAKLRGILLLTKPMSRRMML